MRKKRTVVVYSENWVHQVALETICRTDSRVLRFTPHLGLLNLSKDSRPVPDMAILDIPPRDSVMLILRMRQIWPGILIFVTQRTFLFSDRVVADFFGGIWLREYDAIMAGLPDFCFSHCLTSPAFTGVRAPVKVLKRYRDEGDMMDKLHVFLRQRFSQIVSLRVADIIFRWLVRDIPLTEICHQSGLKEKTVYHYREQTMKLLGIRHYSRDFMASLTVRAGRLPLCLVPQTAALLTDSHRAVDSGE